MSGMFCDRESEVLALVAIDQWPRQADDELVAHTAHCAACADAIVVALALRAVDDDERTTTAVPDAAAVWQRAQWQARRDAMRVASRPVVVAQAVAAIGLLVMVVAGIVWIARLAGGIDLIAAVSERASEQIAVATSAWTTTAEAAGELATPLIWGGAAILGISLLVVGIALLLSTIVDADAGPEGPASYERRSGF